jgi:hypothetical protein
VPDFPCRLAGEALVATVGDENLTIGALRIPYVDIDGMSVADHRVTLSIAGSDGIEISHLARRTDEFVRVFREARARARRAALLQWTNEPPIDVYPIRVGDEEGQVVLFADGVTLEPMNGSPQIAPLGLIERVARDGYRITLVLRGTDPVVLPTLAKRTDEFLVDLDRARSDLGRKTAAAYGALDETLLGFDAPDGWAVDAASAGRWWGALRAAMRGSDAERFDALASLAGDRLRLGLKMVGDTAMPFALVPHGAKVAVESFGDEARATYVFRTDDVDWLNVVLLVTSFRREVFSLAEAELGRWAVAVRTLPLVRAAREAYARRVIHDEQWPANLAAALGSG